METIEKIKSFVEENQAMYVDMADRIWGFAELAYAETQSYALHIDYLEKAGFRIQHGVAGIPTAFIAEAGQGAPVIAILGEYDALAGLSQESGAFECRASPETTNGNGHGCGHHLLGTAAHLAAAAVKEALELDGLKGTVRFYGCPAEEGGAGKTFMAREGLFDDVDAALTWHPAPVTSVLTQSTLANLQAYFRFSGRASHASTSPEAGRSALDAVELMNVGANYMREHMPSDARVHYAVTNSGGPSPNIVQARAEVLYMIRATNNRELQSLYERVCNIARGAALMTECKLELVFDKAVSNLVLNTTLNKVMARHLEAHGGARFSEEDTRFAIEMQQRISRDDIDNMGRTFGQALRAPVPLFEGVASYDPKQESVMTVSTDVGDVSWNTPTAQCMTACYAFGTAYHSWQMVAQGKTSIAHKGMLLAAKTLASTAIELLKSPDLLAEARAELKRRLDGKAYICPIPEEVTVALMMGAR